MTEPNQENDQPKKSFLKRKWEQIIVPRYKWVQNWYKDSFLQEVYGEVIRPICPWLRSRSYRRYSRARQNHFARGRRTAIVLVQTLCFALLIAGLAAYADRHFGPIRWVTVSGVGLSAPPQEIVQNAVSFLLTALPLFTAVMAFVISGNRQSFLSLELLGNPKLNKLMAWYGVSVAYGMFLAYFTTPTAQFNWLCSQYVFGFFLLRTVYLACQFLSQQLRRTSLEKEMDLCLEGVAQWSKFIENKRLTEHTKDAIDCALDCVESLTEALKVLLDMDLIMKYRKKYDNFNSRVDDLISALVKRKEHGPVDKPILHLALRLLMVRYAALMAYQAENKLALGPKPAEDACVHLDAVAEAYKDDRLLPVYGISGLRAAVQAYLRNHRHAQLSLLLEQVSHLKALEKNQYAQLGAIRLLQGALKEAIVLCDQVATDKVMYALRDLANKHEETRPHLYMTVLATIIKTIEHSNQDRTATLIRNFVNNFEPKPAHDALKELTQLPTGQMLEPTFPNEDLDELKVTKEDLEVLYNDIGLPLRFNTEAKHREVCTLKFIILWYGHQKYLLEHGLNINLKLTQAELPPKPDDRVYSPIELDFILSRLRSEGYLLQFLSDEKFLWELRTELRAYLCAPPPKPAPCC